MNDNYIGMLCPCCKDVWGEDLGDPVLYQYLDLQTKRGTQFGQENLIELARETTPKAKYAPQSEGDCWVCYPRITAVRRN